MLFFWDVMPWGLQVDTNILEEYTFLIFRAEEGGRMFLKNTTYD